MSQSLTKLNDIIMDSNPDHLYSETCFSDVNFTIQSSLSQDDFISLLAEPDSIEILKTILSYKSELTAAGKVSRRDLPLRSIYEHSSQELSDVACAVLRFSLFTQETDRELVGLISYINSNNEMDRNIVKFLTLFDIVFDVCDYNKCPQNLKLLDMKNLENMMIAAIKSSDKKVKDIAILEFLPKCFIHHCYNPQFIETFYHNVMRIGDITLLCSVLNNIFKYLEPEHCTFLLHEPFWLFLEEYISNKDPYSQKLAIFILSKAVNYIYKNVTNSCEAPFIINDNNQITYEQKDAWIIFFHLLDVSREKQLHLIEPCLGMLEQTNTLPLLWQNCLYKVFLKHNQNVVVYCTIEKVFNRAYEKQLLKHALQAINIYDYSTSFKKSFSALKRFCEKLPETQFQEVVGEWLEISWNPVAVWYFCKTVISERTHEILLSLLLSVLDKIKNLPHVYIRTNCLMLLLKRCIAVETMSVEKLITVLRFVHKFNKDIFVKYITNHKHVLIKYNFTNVEYFWTEIKDGSSHPEVILLIILHLNLDDIISYIKENMHLLNDDLKDKVFICLFDKFSREEIAKYIMEKHLIPSNLECDCLLFEKLKTRGYPDNLQNIAICAMTSDEASKSSSEYQTLGNIISNSELFSGNVFRLWTEKHLELADQIDGTICNNFIDLYFDIFLNKNRLEENVVDRIQKIITLSKDFFHSKDDTVILKIFKKLDRILEFQDYCFAIISEFLHLCSYEVVKLTAKSLFRKAVEYFVCGVYNSKHLRNFNYRKEVLKSTEYLINALKQNDHFLYTLTEQYKKLSMECPNLLEDFVPVISEILFFNTVTNKAEQIEYFICQEIAEYTERDNYYYHLECPNILKMQIRLKALECLNTLVINGKEDVGDQCVFLLMNKYKQFYKKRYFPDSQVHFQQLRIVQTLLVLEPYIHRRKYELQEFIMDSFCEEIHQPCVRQLMQWLLILLMKDSSQDTLLAIRARMDNADRTQPSAIVAFIPVLYHLALLNEEKYCCEVIELLLLWTMGAHFKLRVYSQVAIIKLFEIALLSNYKTLIVKYKYLYEALIEIRARSKEQFIEVLKTDSEFIDLFNPISDYSAATIFFYIPRLNSVHPSEWENVDRYINGSQLLQVKGTNQSLVCRITHKYNNFCESQGLQDKEETIPTNNVQKKITPWKTFLDDTIPMRNVNDLILMANLVDKPANLGGLSRTCEVFGVKQLVVNGKGILKNTEFKSLSMSSENWMEYIELKAEESQSFIQRLKSSGYTVIGAEQTSESVSLTEYKFPKKCALVLGNEKEGISPDIIPFLDVCVQIPQFGVVRSLNVHVAGSLFMWEYTKQNITR